MVLTVTEVALAGTVLVAATALAAPLLDRHHYVRSAKLQRDLQREAARGEERSRAHLRAIEYVVQFMNQPDTDGAYLAFMTPERRALLDEAEPILAGLYAYGTPRAAASFAHWSLYTNRLRQDVRTIERALTRGDRTDATGREPDEENLRNLQAGVRDTLRELNKHGTIVCRILGAELQGATTKELEEELRRLQAAVEREKTPDAKRPSTTAGDGGGGAHRSRPRLSGLGRRQ